MQKEFGADSNRVESLWGAALSVVGLVGYLGWVFGPGIWANYLGWIFCAS